MHLQCKSYQFTQRKASYQSINSPNTCYTPHITSNEEYVPKYKHVITHYHIKVIFLHFFFRYYTNAPSLLIHPIC